jgi:hypothetical protein
MTWPTHLESKPTYFKRYYGYEVLIFITGFLNDRVTTIGEKIAIFDTPTAWGYWNSKERDMN